MDDLVAKLTPRLRVADASAERDFFEVFGLRTTYEGREYPGFIAARNDAVEFGLATEADADPPSASASALRWQLGVSDVDAAVEVCERSGLDFEVISHQPSEDWRYRVVKVRSPNGFDLLLEGPGE
jgi:hypothetical protein